MKFTRMAVTAFAVVLVVSVFVATDHVSGQGGPNQATFGKPGATSGPVRTAQQHSPYSGLAAPDPELTNVLDDEGRVEQEAAALTQEYSRTEDEGQRAKIKAKLSSALEKQFDLQQKRRELEVARVETQLKKLRELMRKRSEARKTIVEKRLDQLLQEADGLGWTAPLGAPNSRSGIDSRPQYPATGPPPAKR
jgi:hypothetical protein